MKQYIGIPIVSVMGLITTSTKVDSPFVILSKLAPLIPILKKKGQNYAFIDKWNKDAMEKDTIKIPVKPNGAPDFEYMNSFNLQRTKSNQFFCFCRCPPSISAYI